METLTSILSAIEGVVWGPLMLLLLLGVGLYLQMGLKAMPIRKLGMGFRLLWQGRTTAEGDEKEGEVSPFNALMTSLSATIGTGNIAGVATAIFLGGPGAVFWMWITALVGMATKFAEAVLAVRYREIDEAGDHVGGPMYYIRNGLGRKWAWLGGLFAFFGAVAAFGIGNTVQSNSVADGLNESLSLPPWLTGIVIMLLAGAVILGGIKRIAKVAGKLVPLMAVAYIICGLLILIINADQIGSALGLIFGHAFSPASAVGGFAGAAVAKAIQFGVARGVFSNEAGLGSAPIAHAAAQTKNPVRQGLVAMLGTFIDTIIVCSITALAILTTSDWTSGETGAALTSMAFDNTLPGVGQYVVSFALAVFAFTTILGWAFYGEKCFEYLFGVRSIKLYRVVYILAIFAGAVAPLDFVWLMASVFNALMAIPNLIALALLSPVVFKLTKDYFEGKTVLPGEDLGR
ncbi:sodium:alanine symporter family protein [Halomonas sp. McH1-25]|uniref:alanine/glycine:cation symporter family protein n=1 Tax=unclassified Halomonas TaxID=2609666 RepID=UPI001EF6EDAA|nr:sodium:alanine symporter family protein [Halomonas sp. McH1-25]MCP1341790.1 sodium:alanine symporter family protein [Halomonas sp. FL8]MCP1361007.1 sodium:alanine symporter family protein [Halomonas sp. BBD45]MCP1365440.1 sodium:alanine symporter family protein [Halomonas sp. BBD48]